MYPTNEAVSSLVGSFFIIDILRKMEVRVFMEEYWVTTLDNPFNYFTQFDDWYRFDEDHRYNTCGYVARQAEMLGYSSEMSETRQTEIINEAVERICQLNLLGIYKKITRNSVIKPVVVHISNDEEASDA